ncbi:MAG: recombinase family protein, partial [Nitrospirae bacterium]|nr:recombinase family protein [Candidatus Troglogloeales bacterium]
IQFLAQNPLSIYPLASTMTHKSFSMNKFFLYARKSTDEPDRQILSIEAQIDELKEFATQEQLEIVETFVESQTAKEPGRPIFNNMPSLIKKGKASGILAWHPDRLARNSIDGGRIIYLYDLGKIKELKFPTFWFDATPQGNLSDSSIVAGGRGFEPR